MQYKLAHGSSSIVRSDGACIPADPSNADYAEYLSWLAEGNTPGPADLPAQPTLQQRIDAECQKFGIANEITLEGLMAGLLAGALVTGMTEAQLEQVNPAFSMGKHLRALFAQWRAEAQP